MKKFAVVALFFLAAGLLFAAGAKESPKAEGKKEAPKEFVTYGMPHEHVWGALFDAFCAKYNLVHVDTDRAPQTCSWGMP